MKRALFSVLLSFSLASLAACASEASDAADSTEQASTAHGGFDIACITEDDVETWAKNNKVSASEFGGYLRDSVRSGPMLQATEAMLAWAGDNPDGWAHLTEYVREHKEKGLGPSDIVNGDCSVEGSLCFFAKHAVTLASHPGAALSHPKFDQLVYQPAVAAEKTEGTTARLIAVNQIVFFIHAAPNAMWGLQRYHFDWFKCAAKQPRKAGAGLVAISSCNADAECVSADFPASNDPNNAPSCQKTGQFHCARPKSEEPKGPGGP